MRDFKGMKRQRGRNRGGGGGGQGGGGGGKPQHNINRAFDSNGPENVKVRGAAQLVYEKYQALARDATLAGDRVLAENHLQHAEHYFRTLRAIQPNRPASDIVSRDSAGSGYDIDFEDETAESAMEQADAAAAARAGEPPMEAPGEGEAPAAEGQPRFERDRGERREWRERPERQDRPAGEFRDRANQGQGQADRPPQPFNNDRQDRGEFRDRNGQNNPNQNNQNGDRPRQRDRDDRFRDRDDRSRDRDAPRAEGADRTRDEFRDRPNNGQAPGQNGDRPRPRDRDDRFRDRAEGDPTPQTAGPTAAREEPVPVLRSEDGGVSQAPGFLQAPAAPFPGEEGEGRRPRARTRTRRPREDGEGAPPAAEVEEA